jgi:hypothetical protein
MLSRIARFLASASHAWGTLRNQAGENRVIENARRAISREDFSAAEDVLTAFPNQPVRHIEAAHLLGVVLNRTGRPERAEEILAAARELAPDNEAVLRDLAIACLAQCHLGDDMARALNALSRRLDSEAPTAEVQRLLDAGLRMSGSGDSPATASSNVAYLLGLALLSMNEDGADACSRAWRGTEDPGAEYVEFDLRTPILEYCRKLGHTWKVFDDLRLRPIRRDLDPLDTTVPGIPSFLCALPEGMVLGTSFIPATQTGHAFPDQCIHNPRKLKWENAADVLDMVRLACPSRLLVSSSGADYYAGPHLLVGNSENFAHWLLNHLPRLRLAEDMPTLADVPVIVGDDIRPSHLDCLIRAGIAPERIVYLRPGRIATFGELWVPSLLFCGIDADRGVGSGLHWNPELLAFLRRRLRLDFSARPTRRIFISRKNARWRRLLNEEEVVSVLQPLGFEIVDPGAMTLDEQLDLAASSQIIVGALGAGIYFFLFAPEGTPVVELKYDTQDVMDFNWALAAGLKQPHHVVIGESRPTDPDILKRDFTVSADRVREIVEQALGSLGAQR